MILLSSFAIAQDWKIDFNTHVITSIPTLAGKAEVVFESRGDMAFDILGNKIQGKGKGEVGVSVKGGGCSGYKKQSITFPVSGSYEDGVVTFDIFDAGDMSITLQCEIGGSKIPYDAPFPLALMKRGTQLKLEDGKKETKTIKYFLNDWDVEIPVDWTFTMKSTSLKPVTFKGVAVFPLDQIDEDKLEEVKTLFTLYHYFKDRGDTEQADIFKTRLNQLFQEAARDANVDPSAYDVFTHLEELRKGQVSMSDEEKKRRLRNAKQAYSDILIDQARIHAGLSINRERHIEKRRKLKAEYNRILQFDPGNVEANKAMADLLRDEGKMKEALIFFRKSMSSTDKSTHTKTKAKVNKDAQERLGVQAPASSSFVKELGTKFTRQVEGLAEGVRQQARDVEIWIENQKIKKTPSEIWDSINSIIFSIDKKKIEGLVQ